MMATQHAPSSVLTDEQASRQLIERKELFAATQLSQIKAFEVEEAENLELPGADVSDEGLSVDILPKQLDEFTCAKCFLVHHRSQLDHDSSNGPVCTDCS